MQALYGPESFGATLSGRGIARILWAGNTHGGGWIGRLLRTADIRLDYVSYGSASGPKDDYFGLSVTY